MNDRMKFQADLIAGCQRVSFMPWRARRVVSYLAASLVLLASPVGSTAMANPPQSSLPTLGRHLVLTYEVHAGGLHVFSFEVDLGLESQGYKISASGGTRGISSFLYKWDVELAALGGPMRPKRYVTVSAGRQPTKTMQLDFIEDGSFSITRNLPDPAGETSEESELPSRLPDNIVDPLSATLAAARHLAATGRCEQTIPVFDGKRRYDLSFHDNGVGEVPDSRISIYRGAANLCGFTLTRISGFKKVRHYAGRSDAEKVEPPKLWIAKVRDDMPPVPVRYSGTIGIGHIVVHLTKIQPDQEVALNSSP
jgi:hypothetical protein